MEHHESGHPHSESRHHRRGSLERYRPGAMHSEDRSRGNENGSRSNGSDAPPHHYEDDRRERRPDNDDDRRGDSRQRGGRRGGGRRGGGGRVQRGGGGGGAVYRDNRPPPQQREQQYRPQYQDPNDLRHRLNDMRINEAGPKHGGGGYRPNSKRNTENFNPSHAPPEMRILCAQPGIKQYNREYTSRDVLVVSDLFCQPDDLTIYNKLLREIQESGVDEEKLWQSWHGDSHVIADDKRNWKQACPTFHMVLDKLAEYFRMDIKATRLNWYRDSTEWKPFHHDAAAVKPDKAKTQNFTAAVSFGLERDAAFEHAKTKTIISMPQPNGTVYTFGKDVNIIWRHGILQMPPEKHRDEGRISIIAWGWIEQTDM